MRQNRKCEKILRPVNPGLFDSPAAGSGKGELRLRNTGTISFHASAPQPPAAPFISTPREPVTGTVESELLPFPTFAGSAPPRSRATAVLFYGAGEELKARRPPCPASARPFAHAWPPRPRARTRSVSSSSRPLCGPRPHDLVGSRSSAAASGSVAAGTAPVAAGDAAGLGS